MRLCFPVLTVLALTLWGMATSALVWDRSSWLAVDRADRAAWATLAVHGVALIWSRVSHRRESAKDWPEWVRAQASKHRLKGMTLSLWGLAMLGLGWKGIRDEPASGGWPGQAIWFGISMNLGFQPGLFVAEWLAITAQTRLIRAVSKPQSVRLVVDPEH